MGHSHSCTYKPVLEQILYSDPFLTLHPSCLIISHLHLLTRSTTLPLSSILSISSPPPKWTIKLWGIGFPPYVWALDWKRLWRTKDEVVLIRVEKGWLKTLGVTVMDKKKFMKELNNARKELGLRELKVIGDEEGEGEQVGMELERNHDGRPKQD